MSNMKFKYFRDPENFTFIVETPSACSLCGDVGLWFSAGGYKGVNSIKAICPSCLSAGKLIPLEIEANLTFYDGSEAYETITYKTPALPVWQDTVWPVVSGEWPIFERLASKEDFDDKSDFLNAFYAVDQTVDKVEWLWNSLPAKQIKSLREGRDVQVYLFTLNNKKLWIWDAC
jgi:uncharacterized protein CbrC (UPF0167 family)